MNERSEKRVGVVGIAGAWSTETLADRLSDRTGHRIIVELDAMSVDLAGGSVVCGDHDLTALDGLIVKKLAASYSPSMYTRLDLLRFLEGHGVRVFSKPTAIASMLSRASCTTRLAEAGIPIPKTVMTESLEQAKRAVERFGKAVLKPLYSTKARGMIVVSADDADLEDALRDYQQSAAGGERVMYIQQVIPLGDRDYGVVFVGGQHIGSYARVRGEGAWNTTTQLGGHYERYDPPAEVIELARRAQEPFGLDFTSVDVAQSSGDYVVFEVSAFGGYRGLSEGSGVDAAAVLADHVIAELSA